MTNVNVSIDLVLFKDVTLPAVFTQAAGNGHVIDLIPRTLTSDLVHSVMLQISPSPVYLTGLGGVGKSSILFMTAASILQNNNKISVGSSSSQPPVLLLYISDSGDLVKQSPAIAAARLCTMITSLNSLNIPQFHSAISILKDENLSYIERWNQLCIELSASLLRTLILVDEWNAIIDAHSTLPVEHPLRNFSSITSKLGAMSKFVGAVSSSFSPLDIYARRVFPDAYAERCGRDVAPLTLNELKILRDIWAQRVPQVIVDDPTIITLYDLSGGIPRICEIFAAEKAKDPNITLSNPAWQQQCTNNYHRRILSLGNILPPENNLMLQFLRETALLYLRSRELPSAASEFASHWLNSGLLKYDTSMKFLVPVNIFVSTAIDNYVCTDQMVLLRNLHQDNATRWWAIELFFFLQLRSSNLSNILFTGTDLRGTNYKNFQIDHVGLNVVEVDEEFAADPVGFLNKHNGGQPFLVGTLLIPKWTLYRWTSRASTYIC